MVTDFRCLPFLFWVCSKLLALNLQVVYKKGKTLALNQRRIGSDRAWSSWAIDVGRLAGYIGCEIGSIFSDFVYIRGTSLGGKGICLRCLPKRFS
jgi:hypothetical protein